MVYFAVYTLSPACCPAIQVTCGFRPWQAQHFFTFWTMVMVRRKTIELGGLKLEICDTRRHVHPRALLVDLGLYMTV